MKENARIEQDYVAKDADFETDLVALDLYYSFSCQINILNGNSLDADVTLQVSNDGERWVDVTSTTKNLAGATDSQVYDVVQSSVAYARVKVVFNGGDADFNLDWVLKN